MKSGIEYALEHQYDWIWILDADSVPRPNALELLTRLIERENGRVSAPCARRIIWSHSGRCCEDACSRRADRDYLRPHQIGILSSVTVLFGAVL